MGSTTGRKLENGKKNTQKAMQRGWPSQANVSADQSSHAQLSSQVLLTTSQNLQRSYKQNLLKKELSKQLSFFGNTLKIL